MRAWQALLHAHEQVVSALDAELQGRHGLSIAEYDVLLRLARAPQRSLPMTEVAERVLMSPSGVTRLVDRLARRGLVRRQRASGDGRVVLAVLTPDGLRRLRRAASTHLEGIYAHFTGRLSERQLAAVASALEAITGPHEPH
jgi:DNA-binding MarR family transcriptional regulator